MPKNLLSQLLCGVTGKGSPPTGPVHSRLLRWWPLGRSMPRQVFSVFATPHFLISGFVHHNLFMWSRILHDFPIRSPFLRYLEFGVDARESLVNFEGSFQGQVYSGSSPPPFPNPLRFSPKAKAVKPFLNLSLKLFWSE